MYAFPVPLQKLVRELSRLPSIGEKSATRLAYHIINNEPDLARSLAGALIAAIEQVKFCKTCFALTEDEECRICRDDSRNKKLMCVVEKPMDLIAIEKIGEFKGVYHVLHGVWAPLRGMGPETMRLDELLKRIKEDSVEEVIMATGSTVEGDATALYIARLLSEEGVRVSRLAQGMPKGGELEYLDDVTLSRALQGRGNLL